MLANAVGRSCRRGRAPFVVQARGVGVGVGVVFGHRPRLGAEELHHAIEKLPHAASVSRRNREHVGEPQGEDLGQRGLPVYGIDLVDRQDHRFPRAAQHRHHVVVDAGQALGGVDDQDQHIRFVDRAQGLGPHRAQDPVRRRIEAPRVHDAKAPARPVDHSIAAVPRHPRHVFHQRRASPHEAVEQR